MRGIILAAGKGSRISTKTDGLPKSFLEVNGKRVIDWQIDALRASGVKEIIIVIGYKIPLFEKEYGGFEDITLVKNPFYESCNVLGSLWFAQHFMIEGFYFMHADTLFDKEIINLLESTKGEILFAVEFKKTNEEEMKVKVKDDKIFEVNKTMNCNDGDGEFTGVAKITAKAAHLVIHYMNQLIEVEKEMMSFFEVAIQKVIDNEKVDVIPVDIQSYRSVEIDFPEDYEAAKKMFS